MITRSEARKLLNRSDKTISRYIKQKRLKPVKSGKRHLFNKTEVLELKALLSDTTPDTTNNPESPDSKTASVKTANHSTDITTDLIKTLENELEQKNKQIEQLLKSLQHAQSEASTLRHKLLPEQSSKSKEDITADIKTVKETKQKTFLEKVKDIFN